MEHTQNKQIKLLENYKVKNYIVSDDGLITINGSLDLRGLQYSDRNILNGNINTLKVGYNKEGGYCYFDNILSKVISVSERKGYIIYTTPLGYIAQKDKYTAHGNTVKKAIKDVEFKVIAEKLKKEPIKRNTIITVQYYRIITGACDSGVRQWMLNNDIPFKVLNIGTVQEETKEVKPITAETLLAILEKNPNTYGLDKFKSLINW